MARDVYFISDRTGITVETLGHSLLSQFNGLPFKEHTRRFIDTADKARAISGEINHAARQTGTRPIVFSTLIDAELRRIVADSEGVFFDFVDTFIEPLESALDHKSSHTVGRAHGVVDKSKYSLRMDAVNYTLATDDGLNTKEYHHADVIILGVSRSGKTPTCLYLALTFGIYAANYPLTGEDLEDQRLPSALGPNRRKLYGLSIDPVQLEQIRKKRKAEGRYASLKQCQYEVRQVEALYRQENIPILNTTAMSVEEIATTILQQVRLASRVI
jgi:hypothetical protein